MLSITEIEEQFEPMLYLQALATIAQADGVADVERDFIFQQAELLGVDSASISIEALAALGMQETDASDVTKKIILRDCILLAALDGEYTHAERSKVHELATSLQISPAVIERMEGWVTRYIALLEESRAILSMS